MDVHKLDMNCTKSNIYKYTFVYSTVYMYLLLSFILFLLIVFCYPYLMLSNKVALFGTILCFITHFPIPSYMVYIVPLS